jgi:hypothetical protein
MPILLLNWATFSTARLPFENDLIVADELVYGLNPNYANGSFEH